MTSNFNLQTVVAAAAALVISTACIVGTVGPVQAGSPITQSHVLAESGVTPYTSAPRA